MRLEEIRLFRVSRNHLLRINFNISNKWSDKEKEKKYQAHLKENYSESFKLSSALAKGKTTVELWEETKIKMKKKW